MEQAIIWLPATRRLDQLTPLENNPFGKITQEKRRRLEGKLRELGVFKAATVDTDGVLLTFNVSVGGEQPDGSEWSRIASGLNSTTEASLRRWGDVNHFTPQLLRRYTAPDGLPLDTQADILSADHDGVPLEPDELWQFIVAHPAGQHTYQPQSYGHRLADAFRRVAGFRLSWAYASTLVALMNAPSAPENDCPF